MSDYERFLRLKRTPAYSWRGLQAVVPDEYAHYVLDGAAKSARDVDYEPMPFLFDYQRDIARLAIAKGKFAIFAECGLGKTLIALEFARHIASVEQTGRILMVAPLMVVEQTIEESKRFYGDDLPIDLVKAADLQVWLDGKECRIGITNYEAVRADVRRGNLIALLLDESSNLKSHYGKWGTRLIKWGRGLPWKLAMTGTPAPNDRIEYANHAVFLDHFRTTNEFLASYFVNRGETSNRWELKPHALRPFYRDLSHWCIFLSDPAVYGWKDNVQNIPPIRVHIEEVPLSAEQRKAVQKITGTMFVKQAGGIGQRSKLMQIAKGHLGKRKIETLKPQYIRDRVDSWPDESSIIWCHFNPEQDAMEQMFPEGASIRGSTPYEQRRELIAAFKAGQIRQLISKPKVLGFGMNLQVATRQVFNGLTDSYEEFHQAVKRSNRVGSYKPLDVHAPVTEIEEPMCANMLRKASRIESDTREQEILFSQCRMFTPEGT